MDTTIDACPLCGHPNRQAFIQARDYLVSNELFNIQKCENCQFLYTHPRPDSTQIGKYYQSNQYVSHAGSSFGIKSLVYSMARNLMVRRKLNWIRKLNPNGNTILDYGCGVGTFLEFCQNKGWEVWGVEPNRKARQIASGKLATRILPNLYELPEQSFDIITLWHVLEHVHTIDQTLDHLVERLSNQSFLLIAVPNPNSFDANHYQEYWAGYDLPRHLYHFVPETMKLLAKKHRLQLVKTIPLPLDAYYVSMLSEKYRNGSFLNGLYQGYRSNRSAKANDTNYSSLVYVMSK